CAPRTPPGTWTGSGSRWAPRRSTTSATPTAPCSAGCTPPSSRTAPGAWCWTAWCTPAAPGSSPTWSRAGRWTGRPGTSSPGPPAVEEAYYRVRSELAERPAAGTVGPTEYENSFITLAYTAAAWPPLARALADHVSGADPEALLKVHERFGESGADDPGYGA